MSRPSRFSEAFTLSTHPSSPPSLFQASLLYQTNRMSEGEALLQRAMRHSISIDAATVIHKSLSRSTSARAHSFTRAPRKAARSTSLQA